MTKVAPKDSLAKFMGIKVENLPQNLNVSVDSPKSVQLDDDDDLTNAVNTVILHTK